MFALDARLLPVFESLTPTKAYPETYNVALVVTSLAIAILAAAVALSISERIAAATTRRARWTWASAGAISMGGGIWSMHFIGMLAFSLPCGITYNPVGTLLSMIPGVLASGVALAALSSTEVPSWKRLTVSAVLMGAGIGAMHYAGMAAMRPEALLRYDASMVAVSVGVAILLAFLSLSIRFYGPHSKISGAGAIVVPAVVMGCAVAGMHYTAMRASYFFPLLNAPAQNMLLSPTTLALLIAVFTALIATSTLVASLGGRQIELAHSLTKETSHRLRVEEALARAAAGNLLLRDRALESISQGVTITDDQAPGNPIIYTNPAFAALSGYEPEEIIGRGPLSFYEIDVAARADARSARARAEKRPWHMECSLKRKDGTTFLDSMTSGMIIDSNGTVTHSVTVHEDVTDLRRRDELLLEAQKMESVGQLTGGIAHDFNNLLTAIKSNAEDLLEDLKDNELLHSQVEIVLQAADRGAGLVAQLMAFARKQELQPKVVDVNALIETFKKLLRSTLPAHIEIDVRKGASLPPVYVDPGRLETAILNLAINARDAMPDAGTITIETSLRTLDADYVAEHLEVQQGDYVLIAVTDTGSGMPPDVVERAFTPFFTTKEIGKGTGLGLSMVYGFVKQSGGHAMIYSEMGLGTVVKIYLPAMDQDTPTSESRAADDARAAKGVGAILLVEDDAIVRQSIGNKLARLGYQVVTANTALDAIETLKSNPHFDLVFSDVIMPGPMNGADLIREVRRRWPKMKVLLTSGYTESTVLGKIELPADIKLLSKPYSNAELAQVISTALNSDSV